MGGQLELSEILRAQRKFPKSKHHEINKKKMINLTPEPHKKARLFERAKRVEKTP